MPGTTSGLEEAPPAAETAGATKAAQYSAVAVSYSKSRAARTWAYPLLCCLAVVACILLANPFNEAGFVDDWSYGRVAMKLAQTGRMQYNGWGSPILLFQSFWALPWIRLLGFSFPVLQTSMIPVSLGFVLLVYATGRRVGLSAEAAAFASIATGTSPLFLPSAASFMTESPGAFFCMLCVYAALRCVQARDSRVAARFLWVLAIAGVIGGANRQIVWSAPIMLVPYLAWMRRRDARFRLHAIAAYAASGLAILALLHFFGQPYAPTQLSHRELAALIQHETGKAAHLVARLMLVCVLTALPAYSCFLRRPRKGALLWLALSGFALFVVSMIIIVFVGLGAPYGNSFVTSVGIASGAQEWFSTKPDVFPFWLRVLLTAVVHLCVFGSGAWAWRNRQEFLRGPSGSALAVFGLFSVGYLGLILPGALVGFAFDRYMLPLLPLLTLALLMQLARHGRRIPVAAWCCLGLFACFAVATTHDYFAGLRTRVALAHKVERFGVERQRISAGFEYDGWSQLERTGYVRVVEYGDRFADDYAKGFWLEFWDHIAGYNPDFVILNWNSPGPVKGPELSSSFRAWTPPFRRSVVAWKRSDLTARLQAGLIASMMRKP